MTQQKDWQKFHSSLIRYFTLTVFYHVHLIHMEFHCKETFTVIFWDVSMEASITFIVIIFIKQLIIWLFATIN